MYFYLHTNHMQKLQIPAADPEGWEGFFFQSSISHNPMNSNCEILKFMGNVRKATANPQISQQPVHWLCRTTKAQHIIYYWNEFHFFCVDFTNI